MRSLSRKDWILLALLTLSWGINWPIMKLGVSGFPPLSFRTISMIGGLPILCLGVKMLSSGRAAIPGYTMPVWAVLCGVVFFGERPARAAWFGVGCALAGALLLMSSEFASLTGNLLGSILALSVAAGWGYRTVLMKRSDIGMPTISLTFWMLSLGSLTMGFAAILFESAQRHMPDTLTWGALLYNAAIIFGFAHTVWFGLARRLPPIASSLSVMMIPVLGVFSGAWLLEETPHWQDYAALILILTAMSTVLLKPRSIAHK